MAILPSAAKCFMLLGQCVPCVKQQASKFKIKRLELDKHLLMVCISILIHICQLIKLNYLLQYFPKEEYVYAFDPEKKCKTGDVVLIEQLPKKMTRLITHQVKEVIFPLGDVKDPLTGKKVVVGKYRDDIERVIEIYGKSKTAFDYNSSPNRGWQENRKDFTDKETYTKYHEFEDNDPYAV